MRAEKAGHTTACVVPRVHRDVSHNPGKRSPKPLFPGLPDGRCMLECASKVLQLVCVWSAPALRILSARTFYKIRRATCHTEDIRSWSY